jgi:hypothetical protein
MMTCGRDCGLQKKRIKERRRGEESDVLEREDSVGVGGSGEIVL